VSLHDGAADVQAQPQAAVVVDGHSGGEAVEDARLLDRADADAVIRDLQAGRVAVRAGGDLHRGAGAEFDGVRQQVGEDLIEARGIPAPLHGRAGLNRQRATRAGSLGSDPFHHLPHQRRQVHLGRVQL
jgi:hypothetical protein